MKTEKSRTVLVDTSFILTMQGHRKEFDTEIIDAIPGNLRLTTTDGVLMELERLARSGSGPSRALAKLALTKIEKTRIEIRETYPSTPNVDTGILETVLEDKNKIDVATSDRQLAHNLVQLGMTVISPRRKGGLNVTSGKVP